VEITAEHERKLDAPEGFELPDLGGQPLESRVFTSVYYDTAEGSLARSGITLRRRLEHGGSLWQLKLPIAEARLEIEQPGGPVEPPAELARLLVAHLRRGPLTRVAELRTRRRGALVARKGTTAEVTVDEVAVMDALRVSNEFVEVEIELREGDPKRLGDIAQELTCAGARPSNGLPKLFQALGVTPSPQQRSKQPFEALRLLLGAQLRELLAHDPGARLGEDPESVHDMRVAVRRTRALLHAGRDLVADDTVAFCEELKWLGQVLGDVRDLDVLLGHLTEQAEQLEPDDRVAARKLLRTLEQRRTAARKALLKALDCDRYLSLLDRFEELLAELEPSHSELTLASIERKQLKKLKSVARSLPDDAPDASLHELRKRGKRARYAAELAGDDVVVRRAKQLQDVLGDHQDAVVAEERLRALAVAAPPMQALVAGRLIAGERSRRDEARTRWQPVLKKLLRAA
jgi:CHAD domain-containing protein